jgi:methylated-DNA-[protein]-cysteine S-methyltransferase
MRAEHTQYEVPGWGVGELWTTPDGVVLAHELEFDADAGAVARVEAQRDLRAAPVVARPPEGAASPPTSTVAAIAMRVGNGSAPKESQPWTPATAEPGRLADELVGRFLAFFAGEDPRLDDVAVDLEWTTPFQHSVATTLRAVPRGEVVSYGELAALAGYPGAARAAGSFCAHNRLMLLVPCHRVVSSTGLGGYGSAGTGVKKRLLALEGVDL